MRSGFHIGGAAPLFPYEFLHRPPLIIFFLATPYYSCVGPNLREVLSIDKVVESDLSVVRMKGAETPPPFPFTPRVSVPGDSCGRRTR
jgi:hypothetical protein